MSQAAHPELFEGLVITNPSLVNQLVVDKFILFMVRHDKFPIIFRIPRPWLRNDSLFHPASGVAGHLH